MNEQPWVDSWPMFEEAHSKFPVLADIHAARLRLARKFNRALPKDAEVELAWREHERRRRRHMSNAKPTIDAAALIRARAKKRRPKLFEECVAFYRKAGYSDAEIARAMADSPHLVDALGREGRR